MLQRIARALLRRPMALLNAQTYEALAAGGAKGTRDAHIAGALDWLLESNRVVPGRNGFSLGHFLDEGEWQPAYVETTGYIIPTVLRAARHGLPRSQELVDAAERSARWLVNVQFRDGAFGNPTHYAPTVFDTGQVIFGLLAAHRHFGDECFLKSAAEAGRWLCTVQESDGAWRAGAYGGRAHTYYATVAWALLLIWRATGDERCREAAVRHIAWVRRRQLPNGFIREASFDDGPAVLHTIGYAVQGLLECGWLLGDAEVVADATRTADALATANARAGVLRGRYRETWKAAGRSRCLTGLAQVALVWTRIDDHGAAPRYAAHIARVTEYLQRQQLMTASSPAVRGGFPGSAPLSGRYFPYRMPNWTAKFYLDLLLFQRSAEHRREAL